VLLARDHLGGDVAQQLKTKQVRRVGKGVFLPADMPHRPLDVALAQIVAAHEQLTAPHCISHESAALVWGLPLWQAPGLVHVRTSTHAGSARPRSVRRHDETTPAELMTQVNGLPVTSLALTAVDCARTMPALDALVVLDAALRAGLCHEDVTAVLDTMPGRRGTRRARLLARHADGGAESPRETWTRFHLLQAGMPTPVTQVPVPTRRGTYWADMGIAEWHLLIEYDGRDKYTDLAVVWDEKLRQDAITATGSHMLRVIGNTHPKTFVADVLTHAPPGWRPTPRPELNH